MPAMVMAHEVDPKQEILDKLGDLSGVELFHNQVLVATYLRPSKTKSGIYLTDSTKQEDKYQGKVGLVLKLGPKAFVSDDKTDFDGLKVEVGDWIFYRPSDGWPQTVMGPGGPVDCRVFDNEFLIRGRIDSPDAIY